MTVLADRALDRFDALVRSFEGAWIDAVSDRLERDRKDIVAIASRVFGRFDPADLKAPIDPAKRLIIQQLLDEIDAWAQAARADWSDTVRPLIRATGRGALRDLSGSVGISFDVLAPGLEHFTRVRAAGLVTHVTDTTRRAIADTLATGLVRGENMDDLRDRVAESDAAFGKSRAETIARTETVGVTNGAQHESMLAYSIQYGVAITKTWLATEDDRTRDSHVEINGEERDIGTLFRNGLMYPGDPAGDAEEVVNCRCTTLYDIVDAVGAASAQEAA